MLVAAGELKPNMLLPPPVVVVVGVPKGEVVVSDFGSAVVSFGGSADLIEVIADPKLKTGGAGATPLAADMVVDGKEVVVLTLKMLFVEEAGKEEEGANVDGVEIEPLVIFVFLAPNEKTPLVDDDDGVNVGEDSDLLLIRALPLSSFLDAGNWT